MTEYMKLMRRANCSDPIPPRATPGTSLLFRLPRPFRSLSNFLPGPSPAPRGRTYQMCKDEIFYVFNFLYTFNNVLMLEMHVR